MELLALARSQKRVVFFLVMKSRGEGKKVKGLCLCELRGSGKKQLEGGFYSTWKGPVAGTGVCVGGIIERDMLTNGEIRSTC